MMKSAIFLIATIVMLPPALYAQEAPKQEITIFMIGNSTMADKPYSIEEGGNPEKGRYTSAG